MYICPKLKVVFLAQARTASRSCVHLLQSKTEQTREKITADHHSINKVTVQAYRDDGWRIITAVRNHYDIIVSFYHHAPHWFNRPKGQDTFANYAVDFATHEGNHYAIPHRIFYKYHGFATHIIRYESLWDDFSEATGLEITAEDRKQFAIGRSDRKPYREYYDEDTRRFIGEWYKQEMERYGYEW